MLVGCTTCEWKQQTKNSESLSGANSAARSAAFPEDPADYKETWPVRIWADSHSRGVSERVNHTARGDLLIMPSLCHVRRDHQAAMRKFSAWRRHFKDTEPLCGDAGALQRHPHPCAPPAGCVMLPLWCSLDWVIDFQSVVQGLLGLPCTGTRGFQTNWHFSLGHMCTVTITVSLT